MKSVGTAADVAERYLRKMREEMSAEQNGLPTPPSLSAGKESDTAGTQPAQGGILKRSDGFDRRVSQFRYGTGEARITYAELLNMDNEPISLVDFNQNVKIRIYFEVYEQKLLSANFNVMDDKKNNITGSNLLLAGQSLLEVRPRDCYQVDYSVRLPLAEGGYSIQVSLTEHVIHDSTVSFVDIVSDAVVFTVSRWENSRVWSKVYLFPSADIEIISKMD